MKKEVFITAVALLALLFIFTGSCGKGKNPATVQPQAVSGEQAQEETAPIPVESVLTEEDRRVIAMSPSARWDYLFARYKKLVYEYHGIKLDDVPYPGKEVSDAGSGKHKVQKTVDNYQYDYQDQVHEEDLKIEGDDTEFEWTISFLERLAGDYTWNGVASIADITPIAMYFEDEWDTEEYPDRWPENEDPHLDRLGVLTDGTYIIDTYDISTLAENYGLQIVGYNVYYMSQSDDDGTSRKLV